MRAAALAAVAVASIGLGPLSAAPRAAPVPVAKSEAQARAIVAACSDRQFEMTAEVIEGGEKRVIHVKLCAKPGEDDATWLKSLRQAAATIKGRSQLPAESRAKIVADLDAEIARIEETPAPAATSN